MGNTKGGRHRLRVRRPEEDHVEIGIQLPADIFDAVRERAEETHRSISGMISHMLARALTEEEDD